MVADTVLYVLRQLLQDRIVLHISVMLEFKDCCVHSFRRTINEVHKLPLRVKVSVP